MVHRPLDADGSSSLVDPMPSQAMDCAQRLLALARGVKR